MVSGLEVNDTISGEIVNPMCATPLPENPKKATNATNRKMDPNRSFMPFSLQVQCQQGKREFTFQQKGSQ
jgi:hypothetical protein